MNRIVFGNIRTLASGKLESNSTYWTLKQVFIRQSSRTNVHCDPLKKKKTFIFVFNINYCYFCSCIFKISVRLFFKFLLYILYNTYLSVSIISQLRSSLKEFFTISSCFGVSSVSLYYPIRSYHPSKICFEVVGFFLYILKTQVGFKAEFF